MPHLKLHNSFCGRMPRRAFLADLGMGFTGLALGAMLHRDGFAHDMANWAPPTGQPHFAPKVKSVIWLFMIGGVSHVESFDPKPALNKFAGKSIAETPYKGVLDKSFIDENVRTLAPELAEGIAAVVPAASRLQEARRKRHRSQRLVAARWRRASTSSAIIRSMWTNDIDHGAQLQFHTGRNMLDGYFPTIGSWIHYGLGTLNENLPQFVVLGTPLADCCGGHEAHRANYLGPEHDGVPLVADPTNPLAFGRPTEGIFREEQAGRVRAARPIGPAHVGPVSR